jgi:hypothetical protein
MLNVKQTDTPIISLMHFTKSINYQRTKIQKLKTHSVLQQIEQSPKARATFSTTSFFINISSSTKTQRYFSVGLSIKKKSQ